jgi:transposase
LAALVQQHFFEDPFSCDLWAFGGRSGSLVRIFWHDCIGMSLYAKRLSLAEQNALEVTIENSPQRF